LSCVQHPPGESESILVFSGFIAEIEDVWLYITAGHILRELTKAIEGGSKFNVWRLGDETAKGKFAGTAIPYEFDLAKWLIIEDDDLGLDYAAVVLDSLYCRALEAGGAVPIPKEAWGSHLIEHDYWALIGIPAETVTYDNETIISAKAVTLVMEPTNAPLEPSEKDQNRFYAQLMDDSADAVESLVGMSGGPIFALRAIDDIWHYSVIGVQSGWYSSDKVVIACPFVSFAAALANEIRAEKLVTI